MAHRRPAGEGSTTLYGRHRETRALQSVLDAARGGRSAVLVLRGPAGIGKSAMLDNIVEQAADFQVARTAGVQSEMELPFAGLQQLCAQMLDRLERLPPPQRDALGTAFGLVAGHVADRFFVALAVLALVSEAADESPLLCVVDDAQWLDAASAQTLAFVARRLDAESVAMLFAVREPSEQLMGLSELLVEGLREGAARDLLQSAIPVSFDPRVKDRIIFEARGNPLVLLELPRELSPAELAGGFGLPAAVTGSALAEGSFQRRIAALSEEARLILLVAAADPLGDPELVRRAAHRLGVTAAAAGDAEASGLLEIGSVVRFRHSLVRSAVYQSASGPERRRVHAALAGETDRESDPDRRAWHRAQATAGPDDEIASELELSASRAEQRGGFAAAGAFLDRAAGMTTDPARRAQLALAAARAKYMAGAPDDALRLLTAAQVGPLDDLGRARVDLLRAQLSFALSRGSDAVLLLLRAARRLEPLDAQLARNTYMDALTAAQFAGRLARNGGVREVAQAALAAPQPSTESEQAADLLLAGLAVRFTGGYAASVPMLKRALRGDSGPKMSSEEELRWMWLASHAAVDLWDDEAWEAMAERHLQLARDTGAVSVLPLALSIRIAAYMFAGELDAATSLIEEVEAAVEATGSQLAPYGRLLVAAWQGQEGEVSRLIAAIVDEVVPRGEGLGLTIAQWARALVSNGTGHYEEGVAAGLQASEHPEDLGFSNWGLFELIVAGAHSGMTDVATAGLERLSEMTHASGTDWGLGVEAHARALLSDGEAAEPLFGEAIERLGRTHIRIGLARAHLNYGEWLRREGRRRDAREKLRIAHDMFTSMSAEGWAGRAERELAATGEQTRKRGVETREDLTTQEAQVARLARDGLSNAEIGARLFISPRTVEYHLHKVFNKLGINSRNQLGRALPGERSGALSV